MTCFKAMRLVSVLLILCFSASPISDGYSRELYSGENNLYPWEVERITEGIRATALTAPARSCGEAEVSKPACTRLVDEFCGKLWSSEKEGNLDLSTGKLRYGKSEKSEMPEARKLDLHALIDSEARLPDDLRARVSPIFSELKSLMDREEDSDDWYDAVNRLEADFEAQVKRVARERSLKKHPELKTIKKSDMIVDQYALLSEDFLDLQNKVLRAKYESHPNWQRAVRVFQQVKQDMLEEIPTWNIPESEKRILLQKAENTKLSLPFSDPRLLSGDESFSTCKKTQVNAYHFLNEETIAVCAGFFNSVQDDSDMYRTLAHEIGHSCDSHAQASAHFMRSPAGRVIEDLCNAKGPVFSCADWNMKKQTTLKEPAEIREPFPTLRKLTSCLQPENHLKPFSSQVVKATAEESANSMMSDFASNKDLTDLAQHVRVRKDKEEPQQYFMRPDRLRASYRGSVFAEKKCSSQSVLIPEILTQELACLNYPSAAPEKRAQVFKEALKNTEGIQSTLLQNWFSFCGRECPELVSKRLSRVTFEDTADWIGRKLLARRLKRESSAQKRREMATASYSHYCEANSTYRSAKDLVEVEKLWSHEPHPENRLRILAAFSPEIADLVECERDEKVQQGASKCEL